ncbi:family 43 glycosylhydrolase [Hymenobacter taeanensis]|uniref:Family 43 glycosylhydrolase n=1 Tax=Hymenobacter taeanensis TaxID=2735321 RepID=A0A6M6BHX8_9BACT|nr:MULTISPECIES: family 43 glycosylhydrolase [Hymenobacter]QJX48201.1 family 43 glycosylhydrolase [Hymenobacter taeanensis]UOQ82322.1 family 43 glycosylhydrolase [Hymenobacter sp. 5414T-23]
MIPSIHSARRAKAARGPLRHLLQLGALLIVLLGWPSAPACALQGALGVHDPSTIVKEGNKYWIFATGQGIYSMYSTDLVNWTPGPRTVFVNNAYPGWINGKVPGFAGNFWAPECIFLNGKYYLYYSCSTFGSKVSAIGLATNVTLDPTSPNYKWEDQGEVVSTSASSDVNAIDPAVFRDTNGDVWLSYGSFFGGIRVTQLSATTGKPTGGTTHAVANGNPEAAYLTKNGSFYYLFVNRGACCNGVNSTYYMVVGRSASPTGPFLDQNGADLNNGGGTVVLNAAGRYIGPGHTGIYEENGVSYFSHHYYDGFDNGAPKLGIAKLTWTAAGWPSVTRDWVTAGRYEIRSQNSNLVWDAWGCTGVAGQMIAQGTPAGLDCQRWDITPLGEGEYKITNALGGLAADVAGCSPDAGAKLQLGAYTGAFCQRFRIDRANDGTLVFASANGNRVVEVPNASTTVGQQLGLWDYNGCSCQRWTLTNVSVLTSTNRKLLKGVSIYPQPTSTGSFTVALAGQPLGAETQIVVTDLKGAVVYRQEFSKQLTTLTVQAGLAPGVYQIAVRRGALATSQKLVVL